MNPVQIDVAPPSWLPAQLAGAWAVLDAYPLLLATVLVVVGVVLAFAVRYAVVFWGLKLAKRSASDLDDRMIRLGAGVLPVAIVYVSCLLAAWALPLGVPARTVVMRGLSTLLVLYGIHVGFQASYIGLRLLGSVRERYSFVEERTLPLFDLIATLLVVAIAALAFLRVWHIDPTAWIASAGLIGLGLGFAAKDTLANLIGGIFIIADAPYRVGDYILLDSGERGEVTRVGIRSTRVVTRDDIEVIIPNALMANQKIVNESGGRWLKSRLKLNVGVAYGSDVDKVIRVLQAIPASHPNCAKDPAPAVAMIGLGESSLDFELQVWIHHPGMRGGVTHEMYVDIYKTLTREGIEMPFPQRDLWVRKVPEAADALPKDVLQKKDGDGSVIARNQM